MKQILFILLLIVCSQLDIISQETYNVSINDRNSAIELTNNAIKNIENKNNDKAVENLLEAINIDSTYRNSYLYIYQAGINYENYEIIIKALNKGKRIFQEDDELSFYCGEIYRSKSDFNNAIIEYTNAIKYAKINGEDFYLVPYYYLNRANCFLKKKQYLIAIDDYNKLLQLDSESTSGLTNRGTAFYKLGEKEKACRDWKSAVEKGAKLAKKYYNKNCKNN